MGWLTPPKLRTYSTKREPKTIKVQDLPNVSAASSPARPNVRFRWHDGEKFPGGAGSVDLWTPDYWTLRQRSAELFQRNLYARGAVRTLITNEINTGLHLEATPTESLLGLEEDALADWSEDVENRFDVWARDPFLCDQRQLLPFGELQALARQEALVVGDVLVVLRQDPVLGTPRIQLVNGERVYTPIDAPRGANITHGVERDSLGRHVAFWVTQADGTSKRLPAIGEKSGRRLAWLLYGSDRRMDDVRGEPLLSIAFQSLKDIDRYRDAAIRKALINSYLAMYIAKNEDKPGTRPLSRGAVRRGTELATDTTDTARSFRVAEQIPGYVIEELQQGEEPKGFPATGTDEKFGDFEQTILVGFCLGLEIPPEILLKSFRNNYSASQAAINEFKIYLNRARTTFANSFCVPVYESWLHSEVIAQRIAAAGILEAWRDPKRFVELGAWMSCDWSGNIKPAVDLTKLATGYTMLIEQGLMTRDRAARELTGTKYSKNVQKLERENLELEEANQPLVRLKAEEKGGAALQNGTASTADNVDDEPINDEPIDGTPAGRAPLKAIA